MPPRADTVTAQTPVALTHEPALALRDVRGPPRTVQVIQRDRACLYVRADAHIEVLAINKCVVAFCALSGLFHEFLMVCCNIMPLVYTFLLFGVRIFHAQFIQ